MRRVAPVVLALLALNVAVAALFLTARASGTAAAWSDLPLDDAWIHLVYARSLAQGHGFAYSPGAPEAGFTSPAWVLLLAPAFWMQPLLGGSIAVWVKGIGVLVGTATSVACAHLAERLSGGRRAAGVVAGVAVALDPALAFARVSGMEVALAGTCAAIAAVAWLERRAVWLALALALGVLARPEMAVVVGVLFVGASLEVRRGAAPRRSLLPFVAPVAVAALWSARCLAVTGRPLPNTFYVKATRFGAETFFAGLTAAGHLLAAAPAFAWGLGLALCALGVRLARDRLANDRVAVTAIAVAPVAFLAAVAATRPLPEWQPFYWSRYLLPAWPLLLAFSAVGAEAAVRAVWAGRGRGGDPFARFVAIACVALCGLAIWRLGPEMRAARDRYSWNCQNVREMQVAIGRWIRAHTTARDAVAASDAGAIRFFSGRRTIDLTGLNDHRVLDEGRGAVLVRESPRYFVVFPSWFPNLMTSPRFRVVRRVAARHYTICDCDQDELVVFERR